MQTSVHAQQPAQALHTAALRFALRGLLMLCMAFVVASCFSACGGGGADQPVPGVCYVAGVAQASADACHPSATVQPVDCTASGACK